MGSGLAPGDGALFPEYHCGSELDVLEFFGLRIHLFRLHEDLTPDWDDIRDLVRRNPDARLLYLIGYFGRRPDIEKARLVSSELGLELFEDAALTLFSGHGRLTEGHSRMLSLPKFLGVPRGGIIVDGGSTSADGAIDDSVRTGGGLALQLQMKKRVLRRWLPKRKPKKFQNVNDAEPGSEIVLMPRSYRFTREMAKRWGMNSWLESRIRRMDPMEVAAGLSRNLDLLRSLHPWPDTWRDWSAIAGDPRRTPVVPLELPNSSKVEHLHQVLGRSASRWWHGRHPVHSRMRNPFIDRLRDRVVAVRVHHQHSESQIEQMADAIRGVANR